MHHALECVILDWAGTVVDFGSFAPTRIFVDAFQQAFGFTLTLEEARRPMGLGKWQHIEALGRDPEVDARWRARFGRSMQTEDVELIYRTFLPLQIERVADHADLIPGVLETVGEIRARRLKIGSTTGYPRKVMERLSVAARERGYEPDCMVCADDLPAGGRPGPWMALQCVIELAIGDVAHCVKVDDTAPGIEEGRHAGMWTVGVTLSGNLAGMTQEEYAVASESDRSRKREEAGTELRRAGAHYLVDTVADLLPVLDAIGARLDDGERP